MIKSNSTIARILSLALLVMCGVARAENGELAGKLRELDAVAGGVGTPSSRMVLDDVHRRTIEAAARENLVWNGIKSRADWEAFRDVRIKALRDSVGPFPDEPRELKLTVTRELEGEGYRIRDIVYETRPGLLVTANLYLPAKPRLDQARQGPAAGKMPGILLSHSHHAPKTQSELQDMGIMWARLGCAVLVPDHLGHGERRQHPFVDAKSYAGSFKPSRQDYYFRYNEALQLHLAGESLIGWMVWDLMRGVDVLLMQEGIDREKIVLIGSVAGGGDPAGVTAALDSRIAAVVPFNFGGPQPDDSIPPNAERDFLYFGSGYWESTRCLRFGARDGFAHWMIVASVAPRGLIYSCEFAWEKKPDPVWPRVEKVFEWYGAREKLATAQGRGSLKGQPPESSHCNNVGPVQRAQVYPALAKWFGIAPPEKENENRRKTEELLCMTGEVGEKLKMRPLFELAGELGASRAAAMRERLSKMELGERRKVLRQEWGQLLGNIEPAGAPKVADQRKERVGDVSVERIALEVEKGIVVPVILLTPAHAADAKLPVVVAFAQGGKQQFLRQRSQVIADLLSASVAACLADLRGTGETALKDRGRGRSSDATSVSQSELMLGQTMLGARLRDLRSVLAYLRGRAEVDGGRIGLWGDSFAPVNEPGAQLEVPLDADKFPAISEPMGGFLALLGMLYEEDVRVANGNGGLPGFGSCLQSTFCYFPHDVVVPGAMTAADLQDIAAAIAPRPLRLGGMVDGMNRRVGAKAASQAFENAAATYRAAGALGKFVIDAEEGGDEAKGAAWISRHLKGP